MLLNKQLENSNVLYTRSLNVKVSADVGTRRYLNTYGEDRINKWSAVLF